MTNLRPDNKQTGIRPRLHPTLRTGQACYLLEVMGGCTDCTRLGGCSTRKGEERELLAAILPHLYPTRRWGEPDDLARHRAGTSEGEGRSLARQAAEALQARSYFQPGGEEELCDHIYVLCVGREPGLFELRDREVVDLP